MRRGLSARVTSLFLNSKLTPLIILAIPLFGLLALLETPRTYNPSIQVPIVTVTVFWPGHDSRAVLDQIVRPLEALLDSIHEVAHSYGVARNGMGSVTVRFKVGRPVDRSLVAVYNRVDSNILRLPPGARAPLVQLQSLYDVPILTITLSSERVTGPALRVLAERWLRHLRDVPGVGRSWVQGAPGPALRVRLRTGKLSALGLGPASVVETLESAVGAFPAGHALLRGRRVPLLLDANIRSPEALGRTVVAVVHGRPVFLRNVARIGWGATSRTVFSTIGFGPADPHGVEAPRPAVTLDIAREKGTNGVVVAQAVLDRLHHLEATALPAGVRVSVTRNDGRKANAAVDTLIEHLTVAIVAVVLILLVFLGWREASIVALSIPLILFVVLGIGWIDGQSINRITLFALILSLGLLVDDSIVVIENIHRRIHDEPHPNFGRLILAAVDEIGRPTIVATLTVILAIVPMAFVGGMMGPFMGPIPFNTPVAMIVSLFVAYSIVPYVAYRWLKRPDPHLARAVAAPTLEEQAMRPHDPLHRLYRRLFRPLLASRRRANLFLFTVLGLLLAACAMPLWPFFVPGAIDGPLPPLAVALKMLPSDNVSTLLLEVRLPRGSELARTARVVRAVDRTLARDRYVRNYQNFLGESAPADFAAFVRGDAGLRGTNLAQIRVDLLPKSRRSVGSHGIAVQLHRMLAPVARRFPDARLMIFQTPPGPPVRSQMLAALTGPSYRNLRLLARTIARVDYRHTYGMINIDDSVGRSLPRWKIVVRRREAALLGFRPRAVARDLSFAFHATAVGLVHDPRAPAPVPIIVRMSRRRLGRRALEDFELVAPGGRRVPLSAVARLIRAPDPRPYYTRDQHRVVYVSGHMLASSPVDAVVALTRRLDGTPVPGGGRLRIGNLGFVPSVPHALVHDTLEWLGEMRLTLNVFRDLGRAFLVALVLIYLLLVGYYRSFRLPLIVMGAIPLTLIGVFPGHWLLDEPFTATSMIGVIALAGIVVRNSLLLIDFIQTRRAAGHGLEASVLEAGAVRLRPILLTALAVMLGSSAMLSDPVFNGLAISLIFGAAVSTVLTLFVIPLLYFRGQTGRDRAGAVPS
jgi:multidrug efflux pump subunit AcrB